MTRRVFLRLSVLILSLTFLQPTLRAADAPQALHLPAIFSDNMVLQRNFATPIWGTAAPNGKTNNAITR